MKIFHKVSAIKNDWNRRREIERLQKLRRYEPTVTVLFGKTIHIADSCTFLVGKKTIFDKQVYDFHADCSDPLIIDCGANIGLSVIFFKQRYPLARVEAFEADPEIFEMLRYNTNLFGFDSVKLHNEAVWINNEKIIFTQEGGASGRIPKGLGDGTRKISVKARRLRDILSREKIDFLKIDIEGAESVVLNDCADLICSDRISNLFVEYHCHVDEPQTLHELLTILSHGGFRYHIKEAHTSTKPFIKRSTLLGMDLQLDIYAWGSSS